MCPDRPAAGKGHFLPLGAYHSSALQHPCEKVCLWGLLPSPTLRSCSLGAGGLEKGPKRQRASNKVRCILVLRSKCPFLLYFSFCWRPCATGGFCGCRGDWGVDVLRGSDPQAILSPSTVAAKSSIFKVGVQSPEPPFNASPLLQCWVSWNP